MPDFADAHPGIEELDEALDTFDARVHRHLETCDECAQASSELAQTRALLRAHGRDLPALPPDWNDIVAGSLDRAVNGPLDDASAPAPGEPRPTVSSPVRGHGRARGRRLWLAAASVAAVLMVGGVTLNQLQGSDPASSVAGVAPEAASTTPSDPAAVAAAKGGAEAADNELYSRMQAAGTLVVRSDRAYTPTNALEQVQTLLRTHERPASVPAPMAQSTESSIQAANTLATACAAGVAKSGAARPVVAVDVARWDGEPAALVVTRAQGKTLDLWVLAPDCSGAPRRVMQAIAAP